MKTKNIFMACFLSAGFLCAFGGSLWSFTKEQARIDSASYSYCKSVGLENCK